MAGRPSAARPAWRPIGARAATTGGRSRSPADRQGEKEESGGVMRKKDEAAGPVVSGPVRRAGQGPVLPIGGAGGGEAGGGGPGRLVGPPGGERAGGAG